MAERKMETLWRAKFEFFVAKKCRQNLQCSKTRSFKLFLFQLFSMRAKDLLLDVHFKTPCFSIPRYSFNGTVSSLIDSRNPIISFRHINEFQLILVGIHGAALLKSHPVWYILPIDHDWKFHFKVRSATSC